MKEAQLMDFKIEFTITIISLALMIISGIIVLCTDDDDKRQKNQWGGTFGIALLFFIFSVAAFGISLVWHIR